MGEWKHLAKCLASREIAERRLPISVFCEWFPKTFKFVRPSVYVKPTTKETWWHELWVFLNLAECLNPQRMYYIDREKSNIREGFCFPRHRSAYGAGERKMMGLVEDGFPNCTIEDENNVKWHIWCQYPLPEGRCIDLALARGNEEIEKKGREICMRVDGKILWKISPSTSYPGHFEWGHCYTPDTLIECKSPESYTPKEQLEAYVQNPARKHILINVGQFRGKIPGKFGVIEEDEDFLDNSYLQAAFQRILKDMKT